VFPSWDGFWRPFYGLVDFEEVAMTLGDEIWAKAMSETGMWIRVRGGDAAAFRQFALLIIQLINESHGIKEDETDSSAGDPPPL
jgi:hypothetical protein